MSDYALSTNLYTFAQSSEGFFAWPVNTGEAETINKLQPGDFLVPKFAQAPIHPSDEGGSDWQRQYCETIGVDYDSIFAEYEEVIAAGAGATPFVLRVIEQRPDDTRPANGPWAAIGVERSTLEKPLSTYEFLRLRAVPPEIAAQFKGTVAQGRHLQELPDGTAKKILDAAAAEELAPHLREYTLVEAGSADEAAAKMKAAGRSLQPGDRAFVASPGGLLGVHDVPVEGALSAVGHPIPRTPDELLELFEQAAARVRDSDRLAPARAIAAIKEVKALLEGPEDVLAIDDFGRFYDGYHLLANKINQALEIAKRPLTSAPPSPPEPTDEDDETGIELDELAALQGLDIDLVRKELPDYMVLPDSVLEEAVTALRAGKHLLLSGPPGTGKSTVAEALCRAVVQGQYEVATGTADWTTFDTIGGYMPTEHGLEFVPGIVLRCLQRGRWLVIDELNRADIDKAFGPLFTLLAGTGQDQPNRRAILPYQRDGKNIEIRWAEKRAGAKGDFVLTPGWRLLGTLNVSDKASLFQLSFAFLRRFAVVDVPLPPREGYAEFFADALGDDVQGEARDKIVAAAIEIAFARRQLGPAILHDVAQFVRIGLVETSAGKPTYADPVDAFVTAVRLYAVPQYEGAEASATGEVMKILQGTWPARAAESWQPLQESLQAVALA
jgi:energy-coupling factor transporter ATP-binding protein EcfA2